MSLVIVGALAACGGGNLPDTTTGSGSSGTTPAISVASLAFQLDKNSINNSGTDKAVLTVTALNSSNNPVSGASLAVAVDSGVYTPVSATTDSSGQASGNITIGSSKANRNINATVSLGGKSVAVVVAVVGGQVTLTPLPATPSPGTPVTLSVKVADSNGAGVPNVPVQLTGTLGFNQTVTTDVNGTASANLGAAPNTAGTYSIIAAGVGVTAERDVQVVSTTGGGIPDAVGPISAPSLAITPNTIAPNTVGSTTNRAGLRAVFQNAANQAIQNVRVRFEIVPPGLGSGEQISTVGATVYSDVSGVAIADYIAGTRSSPTNGVVIRACYGLTDASIANGACPQFVTATLTVAGQPLSITLGDNNLLTRGNNSLTYIKQFDVAVADSAGVAVANAIVSASVDITYYGKGSYAAARTWCLNEDTNRNGFLDVGEDVNGNGKLDPRKADVILSFTGSNVTGSNGRTTIQVEYPQNVATWIDYTVKVTTSVAGSEGTDQKSYITSFIQGDDTNGSFLTPPYGVGGCTNPN
ncbi:hypothetical protein B0E49_15785 [Polaromonas sp. C04]|nr:hypothetical protein B0E49_15785 [Polaromonas sp. C04]